MAKLQFPDNRDVFERGQNWFGIVWLKWLNAVQRRLSGFDALTAISTPDVGAAGASYSQAQMQEVIDLLNEVKAAQNTTTTTLQG